MPGKLRNGGDGDEEEEYNQRFAFWMPQCCVWVLGDFHLHERGGPDNMGTENALWKKP